MNIVYRRCFLVIGMETFVASACGGAQHSSVQVRQNVLALAEPREALRAQEELIQLPDDDVIPAVVAVLKTDARFQEGTPRELAYHVLSNHECARYAECRAALIVGLMDRSSSIQRNSAYALVLTPIDAQEEAMVTILKVLRNKETPLDVKKAILRPLVKFGTQAESAFDPVAELFQTASATESVRADAAHAMLMIGGFERAFKELHSDSLLKDRAVLWALRTFAAETKGSLSTTPERRIETRRIVTEALEADRSEMRRAALETLIAVYGDAISIEVGGVLVLNPELQRALTKVMESDPDPSLRNDAGEFLREWRR